MKGVSLILTIIILSVILAIVFGLGAILVGQLKTIKEMGNSVIALYAADTGVERVLKETMDYVRGEPIVFSVSYQETMENDASYYVEVFCCKDSDDSCVFKDPEIDCPSPLSESSDCKASFFCIRSVGTYYDTKRAIEVEVFPIE